MNQCEGMVLVMEEPLGVMAPIVDPMSLKSWGEILPAYHPTLYNVNPGHEVSPFPYNSSLNKKIIFWEGDITQLRVDAVIHPSNETFTDRNPLSDRFFSKAGPSLRSEVQQEIKECKTGEVIVTQGYKLPARFVFHTVGPKYNPKFQTAAENTLHNCYRNIFEKAFEMKLNSIALCPINSVKRNYPPDEGAHVALRTIRRMLEQQERSGKCCLNTVVLVVESSDAGIYEVLLPLYFPRTHKEEQAALYQLPSDRAIGPSGEPVFPDRQIRIIDNPHHHISEDDCSVIDLSSHFDAMGDTSFSHMQGDMDQQRLLGERHAPSIDPFIAREIHNKERYDRLLRRAKTEDLSEISGIGCLYQTGVDRFGRPVIVFVGKWFRFKDINLDKVIMAAYMMQ
ncbi:hypothetical protein AAG570_003718 [Ranatra chinensis]|uniref:Macro domain-containing protein n=1 Tax=Ranatra chinensis TaxID=642074 RepID=A0ABD0Y4H6_9HEMI